MSTHRLRYVGFTVLAAIWSAHSLVVAGQQAAPATGAPTVSQPAVPTGKDFVIERMDTTVRFETDGTMEQHLELRVRVTDAAIQQFGQMAYGYDSSLGTARFERVEVRKPSGQVVRAAADAIKDIAVQVLPNVLRSRFESEGECACRRNGALK